MKDVHSNPVQNTENISPRGPNHEEADPRIIIAYCFPVEHGFNTILVQCVDTDVAVLAVATVQGIAMIQIGIAFGTEKDLHYMFQDTRYLPR